MRLDDRVLVEVGEDPRGISEPAIRHEDRRVYHIGDGVLHLMDGLCASIVGVLNLAKVGDETLQQLSPGLEAVGQYLSRGSCRRHRGGEDAVEVGIVGICAARYAAETACAETLFAAAALDTAATLEARFLLERIVARHSSNCGGGGGGGSVDAAVLDRRKILREGALLCHLRSHDRRSRWVHKICLLHAITAVVERLAGIWHRPIWCSHVERVMPAPVGDAVSEGVSSADSKINNNAECMPDDAGRNDVSGTALTDVVVVTEERITNRARREFRNHPKEEDVRYVRSICMSEATRR